MSEGSANRQTLLVVDDNPENLRVAVAHLQAYSFEILTARDGEAGLKRARLTRPDLILMDVMMPGLDGYETCRRLKADPETAAIPIIFLTVRDQPADLVRAFEVGAVDHVTKPIEPPVLLARVRAHLQIRALQRRLEARGETLEARVAARTADLERELENREAYQRERERLLDMVRGQSEQLRQLTLRWIEEHSARDRGRAHSLRTGVSERLGLVDAHLARAREQALQLALDPADAEPLLGHLSSAQRLLEPALADVADVSSGLEQSDVADEPLLSLSAREVEVLQLFARGKSNKEMAYTLGVAPSTVSTYRMRIMEKIGVEDQAGLFRAAIRLERGG